MEPADERRLLHGLGGLRISPRTYRRVCLATVWALGFIIVTGAAVRLTDSGLGCKDWPTCAHNRVVAPWQYHAMVEFGNRMVTGLVCVAIVAAVLASMVRGPRRRDLVWLSWGLVAGLVGQIVLGGEAVLHHLEPQFVMAHFMLSLVLLGDAVVLYHRSGFADGPADARGRAQPAGPAAPLVPAEVMTMGRLLIVSVSLVIFLGTVVTSSGPHGGDPTAPRFRLSLHDVARYHSSAAILFLCLTVVALWRMVQAGAPHDVIRRGEILLVVLFAQGGVGYLQYFTGVPSWLVQIHVTLAATLWVVTLQFVLGLTRRPSIPAAEAVTVPHPDEAVVGASVLAPV
ncbi:MAG TPA: COX15/CtaA family protein [Acidimicrobiales bacterium]|nr:COX15/CtaA family protein [Acidimicrobiales bacterium]